MVKLSRNSMLIIVQIITLYYATTCIYETKPVVLTTRSSTHEYKVKT